MKKPPVIVSLTALLLPCFAQAQSTRAPKEFNVSEFRQVLLDFGSYLDAHRGTNVRQQMEAVSDDGLSLLYTHLPNFRRVQSAIVWSMNTVEPMGVPKSV